MILKFRNENYYATGLLTPVECWSIVFLIVSFSVALAFFRCLAQAVAIKYSAVRN